MKYFPPERYIALQDFTSDAVMNAADAKWDEAVEQYEAYYATIQDSVPAEYRRLQETYFLHDAVVLYLGRQDNRFVIALRLDPSPQQVLQLTYELAGEARINRDALPSIHRSEGSALWFHDEIELVSEEPRVCIHSILFSNGWEVQLPFRSLRIEEVQVLFPAPRYGEINSKAMATVESE
jgi:hypothetical protein